MGSKKDAGAELRQEAMNMAKENLAEIKALVPPELQDLNLEQLVSLGVLQPEQIANAMEDAGADPRLAQTQYEALEQMKEISQEGMTDEDRLAMMNISDQIAAEHKARQAGIKQEMMARGLGGSGQELLMRLQGGQGSAERQRRSGMELAAQKAAAKRQAIQQMAGMAGGMRQQEFGEQAQKAAAANQIAQFNAQQAAQAQYQNWLRQQQVADQNVALKNKMREWSQVGKHQAGWQNMMQKMGLQNQAAQGAAGTMMQGAQQANQAQGPSGFEKAMMVGSTAGSLMSGYGGMMGAMNSGGPSTIINMAGKGADGGIIRRYEDGGTAEKQVGASFNYKPNVSRRVFKSPQGEQYEEHYFESGPDFSQAPESSEKLVGFADGGLTNGMQQLNPMNSPMQGQQPIAYADGNPVYDSSFDGPDVPIRDGDLAGDEVPARLNEGELVSNLLMQQNQINMLRGEPLISESDPRIDEMLNQGLGEVNEELQDVLVEALRGDESALQYIQQSNENIIPKSLGRLEKTIRG